MGRPLILIRCYHLNTGNWFNDDNLCNVNLYNCNSPHSFSCIRLCLFVLCLTLLFSLYDLPLLIGKAAYLGWISIQFTCFPRNLRKKRHYINLHIFQPSRMIWNALPVRVDCSMISCSKRLCQVEVFSRYHSLLLSILTNCQVRWNKHIITGTILEVFIDLPLFIKLIMP